MLQLHKVYESSNSEGKLEPMSSKKNCGTNGLEIIHFRKGCRTLKCTSAFEETQYQGHNVFGQLESFLMSLVQMASFVLGNLKM
jgi:hypothetical protein